MKRILTAAYAFIAAVIGAGFASGQEILRYFVVFGKWGASGIAAAAALFALFMYAVLAICIKRGATDFTALAGAIGNRHIRRIVKSISAAFSFSVFSAMLAALGEMSATAGIPAAYGVLMAAAAAAFMLRNRHASLTSFNGICGMLLTVAIITCCIYMLRYREYHSFSRITPALGSAGTYAGYNMLAAVPVLAVLSGGLKTRTEAAAAAFIAAVAVGTMLLGIFILTATYYGMIPLGELPMLTLAKRQSDTFAVCYAAILALSSFTTLISTGAAALEALGGRESIGGAAALAALGILFSGIGFSEIINTAYRACGIAGFVICVYLTAVSIKSDI